MNCSIPAVDDLLLLVEVIEAGGFTAASQRIGTPKSRLSRRIIQLEDQLGVCLIQRNSRRFHVTELGWQLFQHGLLIRAETRAALVCVQNSTNEPSGSLRVACPIMISANAMTSVALAFAHKYPRVRLQLDTTNGFGSPLTEPYDLMIYPSPDQLPDSDLVARKMLDAPYVMVAAPGLFQDEQWPDSPIALADASCIGWNTSDATTIWHLQGPGLQTAQVQLGVRFSSDNLLTIHKAALAGLGVARLPVIQCREDLDAGRLKIVLPGWAPPPMAVYVVYSSRRQLSLAGRTFLDLLIEAVHRANLSVPMAFPPVNESVR